MGDENDWKQLVTVDKMEHKNWKARVEGYEEALKEMGKSDGPKDPLFNQYLGQMKKIVVDGNVTAQEKALEVVLYFVQEANAAPKAAGDICPGIVNKCLNSTRAKTKDLAIEILTMLIEIEKHDIVGEELLKGLNSKQPKVIVGSALVLKLALSQFGPKVVPIKEMVKTFPKLLEDRDKGVRDAGKEIILEIYRWIGRAAMDAHLTSLKPIHISELNAEFEKMSNERPVPTRYLRSQKPKVIPTVANNSNEPVATTQPVAAITIDPYEFIEAFDAASKIPPDFYSKIEEKKWTDRKEALEDIEKLTDKPKLVPGDFGDLVKVLQKVVAKDSNIVLVALAAKILYQIANGLRKKFSPYSVSTIQVCLEKFKEKKANVVQALRLCVDASIQSTAIDAFCEELVNALSHKTPSCRSEAVMVINRLFEKSTKETLPKKHLKTFVTALATGCADSVPEVRDSCFQALGTAMKVVSEKVLMPFLENIDPVKMARIKEFYTKAMTEGAASSQQPNAAPSATTLGKVETQSKQAVKQEAKPDKSAVDKKPPKSKKPPTKSAKSTTAAKQSEIPLESVLTDEDVHARSLELFDETFMTQIVATNWKERSSAVERLQNFVKEKMASDLPCQLIIKLLMMKPGLKDNNFQVLKAKIELIKEVVMKGKLTWTAAEACIPDLTEKIGDAKNSDNVKSTLTEIADVLSLKLVAGLVIKTATENVNIKNLTETVNWLNEAIKEFGFKIPVDELLPFLRLTVQHTNPTIRQSAVKLIGTISLYVRDAIGVLLKDEKASTKQLIDQEIDAMKSVSPPAPTRGPKNDKPTATGDEEDAAVDAAPVDVEPEDFIPRENISGKITEEMLSKLTDSSWKIKKEGYEEILKIVENASGILGDGLQSVMVAIVKNCNDANKIIKKLAVATVEAFCKKLNKKDADRYSKVVVPALLASFGDSVQKNRIEAMVPLNNWTDKVGFAAVIDGSLLTDSLKAGNPFQKIQIFIWIVPYLSKVGGTKAQKKLLYAEFAGDILPILYECLEDRNADLRKAAQDAILPFMILFGFDQMLKHSASTGSANLAGKTTIKTVLEKAKEQLPTPEPSATKPQNVSKTSAPAKAAAAPAKETNDQPPASTKPSVEKTKSSKKEENKAAAGTAHNKKAKSPEDEAKAMIPLLSKSSNKLLRIKDDIKKKIKRWDANSSNVEQLTVQFESNCNPELVKLLFSKDFKNFMKAIDMMSGFLSESDPDSVEATRQNLDLILKWMVCRFSETNPAVINKGLEYLIKVFNIFMNVGGFKLHDQEASSFLPDLLLKLGDVKCSNDCRTLLVLILNSYDSVKMLPYIEEVILNSKQAKVRQENTDLLRTMIDDKRFDITEQKPLLKSVALLISERDNNVRSAALNCLVSAYNFMGENLLNLLKTMPEKEKSMLLERIKRSGKLFLTETDTLSTPPTSSVDKVRVKEVPEIKEMPRPTLQAQPPPKSQPVDVHPLLKEDIAHKLINVDKEIAELMQPMEKITLRYSGRATQSVSSNDAITSVIHAINSNEVQTSIQAMAQIDEVIRNRDVCQQLTVHMDNLVMSITMQLKSTLGKLSEERYNESEVTDMFKGMLATLVSIFNVRELAGELNRDRLSGLLQVLLRIVINEQLAILTEGGTIIRGINILSVRILEYSNQTRMLSALLRMMGDCLRNGDSNSKYLHLIFKCIWSMTKNLVNTIGSIDIVFILKDIHAFYTDFPPSYWENMPGRDVPLRTVKTLVYSLINHKGGGVLEALYQIPNAPGKDLDGYIRKSYAKLNISVPTVLPTPADVPEISAVPQTTAAVLRDHSLIKSTSRPYLDELKAIFQKIGNQQENRQGLVDLYDFKKKYPHVDLSRYLTQTTPYFQRTIDAGLRSVAESRGEPIEALLLCDQMNNSGTGTDALSLDPDSLMRRLKDIRVKAGLEKQTVSASVDSIMPGFAAKDVMEVSTISSIDPTGDGPVAQLSPPSQTVKPRKMSAAELATFKQRINAIKNPN